MLSSASEQFVNASDKKCEKDTEFKVLYAKIGELVAERDFFQRLKVLSAARKSSSYKERRLVSSGTSPCTLERLKNYGSNSFDNKTLVRKVLYSFISISHALEYTCNKGLSSRICSPSFRLLTREFG